MKRYVIRFAFRNPKTGCAEEGREFGWSHTIENAIRRADKLSQLLRTDVYIYVTDGTRVVACNDIHTGPFTGAVRPLTVIQD